MLIISNLNSKKRVVVRPGAGISTVESFRKQGTRLLGLNEVFGIHLGGGLRRRTVPVHLLFLYSVTANIKPWRTAVLRTCHDLSPSPSSSSTWTILLSSSSLAFASFSGNFDHSLYSVLRPLRIESILHYSVLLDDGLWIHARPVRDGSLGLELEIAVDVGGGLGPCSAVEGGQGRRGVAGRERG